MNRAKERIMMASIAMERAKKTVNRTFSHFLFDLPRSLAKRMIEMMFSGNCAIPKMIVMTNPKV